MVLNGEFFSSTFLCSFILIIIISSQVLMQINLGPDDYKKIKDEKYWSWTEKLENWAIDRQSLSSLQPPVPAFLPSFHPPSLFLRSFLLPSTLRLFVLSRRTLAEIRLVLYSSVQAELYRCCCLLRKKNIRMTSLSFKTVCERVVLYLKVGQILLDYKSVFESRLNNIQL